jgi:hypothetical protein
VYLTEAEMTPVAHALMATVLEIMVVLAISQSFGEPKPSDVWYNRWIDTI